MLYANNDYVNSNVTLSTITTGYRPLLMTKNTPRTFTHAAKSIMRSI